MADTAIADKVRKQMAKRLKELGFSSSSNGNGVAKKYPDSSTILEAREIAETLGHNVVVRKERTPVLIDGKPLKNEEGETVTKAPYVWIGRFDDAGSTEEEILACI